MEDVDKLSNKEIDLQPNTAWLFDVDGVLTDPDAKCVTQPEIFNEIIKRLENNEPVALNTGRSIDFVSKEILDPIEERLTDKSLLNNIFTIGEKGGVSITYNDGAKTVQVDEKLSVPIEIQNSIRELVSQPPFSDTMFYDETKKTIVTIELKTGITISEFKQPQQDLVKALQLLLNKFDLGDSFIVDPTRIATDIENKLMGKAFGTRKFIELLEERNIVPKEFIGFGDSVSDYDMFEELKRFGKNSKFVFVGDKEDLKEKDPSSVTFTELHDDKGTLQYLQNRQN
jgi:hydroxymethylpyrimidine pyrophosphatase-like HAD family hydrolase